MAGHSSRQQSHKLAGILFLVAGGLFAVVALSKFGDGEPVATHLALCAMFVVVGATQLVFAAEAREEPGSAAGGGEAP